MNLNQFATNKEKEVNGVWHDVGGGTRLLIARSRNVKYVAMMQSMLKPYQNRINRNDPTMEKIAEGIITKVMAKTILLGWEKLKPTADGEEVEYSIEACEETLANPKYKDFRDFVESLSDDMSQYQDEDQEEIVGN